MTSPKAFEYHSFLRDVLRQSDSRAYFLASEQDFQKGSLPRYPYRNYFYGIGIALEGSRQIQIGTDIFEMKEGSIMVIGPGLIRQWLDDGFVYHHEAVFFTSDLFKAPINSHFLAELSIFRSGITHVLALEPQNFETVKNTFEQLRQYRNQEGIVASLVLNLIELLRYFHQTKTEANPLNSRMQTLVRDFCQLLQKHYLESKDVAFYAQKLNLTANHLSETVKSVTGKSAKKHIEEMLILEAKSLLKQTDMTIKEVTYWLGFEDPSYFVKFFKNAEGITPSVYRQNA